MVLVLQLLIVGLATGAIYALIALGYTMVYGIIELINFAHGDIFMIGTFVSLTFLHCPGYLASFSLSHWFCFSAGVDCNIYYDNVGVCRAWCGDRACRLPTSTQCSASCSTYFCDRCLFHFEDIGKLWKGNNNVPFPQIFLANASIQYRAYFIQWKFIFSSSL